MHSRLPTHKEEAGPSLILYAIGILMIIYYFFFRKSSSKYKPAKSNHAAIISQLTSSPTILLAWLIAS